jgi:hypothetical protein
MGKQNFFQSPSQQLVPPSVVNGYLAWSVGSNALTIALKTAAGADPSLADPVYVPFRSTTATDATWTYIAVTAATSLVISSGSTLGHVSSTQMAIYAYFVNNSGTVVLGAISVTLDDGQTMDTVAEGGAGAADSPHVLYTTSTLSGKAIRFAGRAISSQGTAGTWASAMTNVTSDQPKCHDYRALNFQWTTLVNPTSTVPTTPSDGAQTRTLPQPGRYKVTMNYIATHSNTYTSCRQSNTYTGTATREDNSTIQQQEGIDAQDSDTYGQLTAYFLVTAQNQTIIATPSATVAYASTSHTFNWSMFFERIR